VEQQISDTGQQVTQAYILDRKERNKGRPTIALAFCLEVLSKTMAREGELK